MARLIEDADVALSDCAYLVTADPGEVIPLLGRARTPRARLAAAVYRLSLREHRDADPAVRRQILSLDATRLGDGQLARCFAEVPVAGAAWPLWTPQWATGHSADERLLFLIDAHEEYVEAVTCAVLDGRPVAVTGGYDALVRIWDLTTGWAVDDPFTGHNGRVKAVECTERDGRQMIISADDLGEVLVWDLVTRERVRTLSTGCFQPEGLLTHAELDGRLVVVTGDRTTARAWDAASGEPIGQPMTGHSWSSVPELQAMACTTLDGRVVLVTVGNEGLVWDLATGERIAELIPPGYRGDFAMTSVVCTELEGRPVAVAGCDHGGVLVWDLTASSLIGEPLGGYTSGARDLACIDLDGRRVALVGDWNGTIRVWDLVAGQLLGRPVGPPLSGFGDVCAFGCAVVDGRQVVVTGGDDRWVRVWDVGTFEPAGRPVIGHTNYVHAAATMQIGDRGIVAVGGSDRHDETQDWEERTRLWDLATGEPIGGPMAWLSTGDVREEMVAALTYVRLDGRDIAVAGIDRSVHLWDLAVGELVGKPMVHITERGRFVMEKVECTWVDGRPVAVSLCKGNLRVWDLRTCEPFDAPAPGGEWVITAACTVLDGRSVVVTTEDDETVRVWDLASGQPVGAPMTGHTETIFALTCAEVDGRSIAVTGSADGTVRRWDLATGRPIGTPLTGHDGEWVACTVVDSRLVALSSGPDTVQAWDLHTGQPFGPALHFPCGVDDLTTTPQGQILVTFGSDVAMLIPSSRTGAH